MIALNIAFWTVVGLAAFCILLVGGMYVTANILDAAESAMKSRHHKKASSGPHPNPAAKPRITQAHRDAEKAGRDDVYNGWITWAKYPTPLERERDAEEIAELKKTQHGRQILAAREYRTKHRSLSLMHSREYAVKEILEKFPTAKWPMDSLQSHLTDASTWNRISDSPDPALRERVRLTAALITDMREETFDPSEASITPAHAYHEDPQVRAAYLEGRAKGTEDIMDAVTATRTRVQQVGAAGQAIAAANARHKAALAALRETSKPLANSDAHKDYDQQFAALEKDTP